MNPKSINLAFAEVQKYHPEAKILVINSNQHWQFMGQNFEHIVFNSNIDVRILEDVFREVELPADFEYQE